MVRYLFDRNLFFFIFYIFNVVIIIHEQIHI